MDAGADHAVDLEAEVESMGSGGDNFLQDIDKATPNTRRNVMGPTQIIIKSRFFINALSDDNFLSLKDSQTGTALTETRLKDSITLAKLGLVGQGTKIRNENSLTQMGVGENTL
ncbi:MAG: hypothetical protein HY232_04350 [Acidobacteria bacterium]|nr:hypothetical protein [Acidobacteriota bacterium]